MSADTSVAHLPRTGSGDVRHVPVGARPGGRVAWLDHARGIGIALVVLGHAIGGLQARGILAPDGPAGLAVDWIYAFHMPLFFFLSGLLAEDAAEVGLGAVVANKLRTIAWPYLLWSFLQTSLHHLAGGLARQEAHLADLLLLPVAPVMEFWFLHALFLVALLYALARRCGVRIDAFFWASVGLFAAARFGIGSWGPAYAVARHLPYFALGVAVGPFLLEAADGRGSARGAGRAAAMLGLIVLAGVVAGLHDSAWLGPAIAAAGIAAAILAAHRTAALPRAAGLAVLGERSLPIFVAHTAVVAGVRAALSAGLSVESGAAHLVAGVAAGLLGPVALAEACERVGLRHAFTWPRRTAAGRGASPAPGIALRHWTTAAAARVRAVAALPSLERAS